MSRNIITSLDIGTSTVQTLVAERVKEGRRFRVLGVGVAPAAGMRRGIVVDQEDASEAIRASVEEASRGAGVPIYSAWMAVGGMHISVASSKGIVAVSRADGEISGEDVRRAIAAAETFMSRNPNREILHLIPRRFRVDDEEGIRDPVGMRGVRLEADTIVVEGSASYVKGLVKSVEGAGVRVADYVFGPLAASSAVLTKQQLEIGTIILDIGGGVASFIVFEEGVPLHAGVLPVGGNLITHDVAIGFKTHVGVAEQIKCTYGSCHPSEFSKRENIRLAEFTTEETATYPRKELAEIIEARLKDVFELLGKELRKIGKRQLLPGGVVLIGGSSLIPGIVELARQEIGLPAELGNPYGFDAPDRAIASSFATAYGVLLWADTRMQDSSSMFSSRFSNLGKSTLLRWFKSLLP